MLLRPLCLPLIFLAYASANRGPRCDRQFQPCVKILQREDIEGSNTLAIMEHLLTVNDTDVLAGACDGYSQFLKCAQRRMRNCVDSSRTLVVISRLLHLLCRKQVQETRGLLVEHGVCISEVMAKEPTNKCELSRHPLSYQTAKCREICGDNIDCLVGVWISEQSLCSLIEIETACSPDASKFYQGLRADVFNNFYPVLCFSQHQFSQSDPQSETLHSIVASKSRLAVEAASDHMIRRRQEKTYDLLAHGLVGGGIPEPYPDYDLFSLSPSPSEPQDRESEEKEFFDKQMRPINALLGSWSGMPWYLANSLPRPPPSSGRIVETELYGAKVDRNFPLLIYATMKDLVERFVHIYFKQEYARA